MHKIFNKNEIVFGATASLSCLLSGLSSYFIFNGGRTDILWACVFGIFLAFHRFGNNKKTQCRYIIIGSLLALISLTLTIFISTLPFPFFNLFFAIIIFSLLCMHRFIKGGKSWGIFISLYMLIFHSIFPSISSQQILPVFSTILPNLLIATLYILLLILILPKTTNTLEKTNKKKYLFKKSIRTTILLSLAILLDHFISERNVVWIAASILIISEDNLHTSFKKSIERALGTIIGAAIGIIAAHTLFSISPTVIIISCLVLIFLTYATFNYNYTVSITLATVWISASFYLYNLPITFNEFATQRIMDTLAGISIGLIGERLIFPRKITKKPSKRRKKT